MNIRFGLSPSKSVEALYMKAFPGTPNPRVKRGRTPISAFLSERKNRPSPYTTCGLICVMTWWHTGFCTQIDWPYHTWLKGWRSLINREEMRKLTWANRGGRYKAYCELTPSNNCSPTNSESCMLHCLSNKGDGSCQPPEQGLCALALRMNKMHYYKCFF